MPMGLDQHPSSSNICAPPLMLLCQTELFFSVDKP